MKNRHMSLIGAMAICSLAHAQTNSPFVGTWKVEWQGNKKLLEAELTLRETGGSWKTLARNKFDPCVGREVPVSYVQSSEKEVVLTLKFSEALTGCKDDTATMFLNADGSVVGKRGQAELTFSRQR